MATPTEPAREAMLAGMEDLLAVMKDRKPVPDAVAPQTGTMMDPSDEDDPLAAAPWGAVALPPSDPPDGAQAHPARESAPVLERGAVVGRHVVLHELGAGGMGVVYAAYDPKLDRKVALKLLLPGAGGDKARTRLLREAQALGKLAHPNVVGIHDVGTVGEQVWLAMEFVQGQTLGAWLRTPRGWREVLGVMRHAGEGLAAAHAAGLLHRDFKPDNVMVGDDGRVRVMDFGLARARPEKVSLEADRSQPHGSVETLAMQITQAGAIVGTPSYMAPEQFEDVALTAAADQFAFCVTLWQALYGERPFAGRTLMEIIANVLGGRRQPPPKGRAVPSRLRRACERGLSVDPRQRWPSMEALLSELRRLVAPRRWWALGLAGGLAAVGVGIGQYAEVGFRCEGAEAQLDGVWDEARKQEVKEAILRTSLSYAPDTWERVEPRLDEYARAWAGKHTEVCEATSVRQEQSPEVMDLRMECLRGRRLALREAVRVLADADATRVENAVELVASLPGLPWCDDVEALQAELPPPEDPRAAERAEALRERLVQVRALDQAGVYDEALAEAEAVVEEAEEYAPLWAEALVARSLGREKVGRYTEAESDAEQAYLLAVEHGHDGVAAHAVSILGFIVGYRQARHEAGLQWGKTAVALAKRRRSEPELEASSLDTIGVVLWNQGKLGEALTYHQRALAIWEEAAGPRHAHVVDSLISIGNILLDQGKLQEALTHHQRALAISEEAFGPRHPEVAASLTSVGLVLMDQGRLEEALTHQQRALAISEAALGPRHPDLAVSFGNIGLVLMSQGKLPEALTHFQRALAIHEEALGPRHASVAISLLNIGNVRHSQGELEEALTHFQRALAIFEDALGARHPYDALSLTHIGLVLHEQGKLEESLIHQRRALAISEEALGPRHSDVAHSLSNIGLVLHEQGKLPEALTHFQRALAIFEEALGPRHPHVGSCLVGLAQTVLTQHDFAAAREHAERAVSILETGETSPDRIAEARFVLARALWPDGSQQARSRALAEQARVAYAEHGDAKHKSLAEVQAWLAEHGDEG